MMEKMKRGKMVWIWNEEEKDRKEKIASHKI